MAFTLYHYNGAFFCMFNLSPLIMQSEMKLKIFLYEYIDLIVVWRIKFGRKNTATGLQV